MRIATSFDAPPIDANTFFDWYNHDHYHSGIALLTPASVHNGQAAEIVKQRTQVLHAAFECNPEHPHAFDLDDHHHFETGRPLRVCGNTADMLAGSRYGRAFSNLR